MNEHQDPASSSGWVDYTDGNLPASQLAALEAHCEHCEACRDRRAKLLESHSRLIATGRRTAGEPVSDRSLHRVWDAVRFGIRRGGTVTRSEMAFDQLRSILVSMLGRTTTDKVLDSAADGGQGAPLFAANLTGIVDVLCGDKAARLVRRVAESVPEDLVA